MHEKKKTKKHFHVNLLPARYGDCIYLEYSNGDGIYRILVDGGTAGTITDIKKLISELPEEDRHFELLIVTHIDRDHIEGLLSLLEEETLNFRVNDVWFNSWQHLPKEDNESFGAMQGERLSTAILNHKLVWNNAFKNQAVVIPEDGVLPTITLPSGMQITILSPEIAHLRNLKLIWSSEILKHFLQPGFGAEISQPKEADIETFGTTMPNVEALNKELFHEDSSIGNASSIAFLVEFNDQILLFAGDALPSTLHRSLDKISTEKITIDLWKLSHHGSCHNTSPDLIEKIDCSRFVISTNGAIYQHPDPQIVAWILKRSNQYIELFFNYRTPFTQIWNSKLLKKRYHYSTTYSSDGNLIIEV